MGEEISPEMMIIVGWEGKFRDSMVDFVVSRPDGLMSVMYSDEAPAAERATETARPMPAYPNISNQPIRIWGGLDGT